jgi:hypothetical protein
MPARAAYDEVLTKLRAKRTSPLDRLEYHHRKALAALARFYRMKTGGTATGDKHYADYLRHETEFDAALARAKGGDREGHR